MYQRPAPTSHCVSEQHKQRAQRLLAKMTLAEKLGQLHQVNGAEGHVPEELAMAIREGGVGSILNEVDPQTVARLQHLARHESRLGIPLLIGRDVIHGFHTVFPIPLGMASSWCEQTVKTAARVSAVEATSVGINWTFSPMIDIGRDPRWGRVAESFGEDPFLTSVLGAAMIKGYQGESLSAPDAIAACAKHFAGYGASESGRDYNTTNLSEHDMREVHLPPFQAAVEAGVASIMTSFSDINGMPASANTWLLDEVLRQEWQFEGMVVSDWESVAHLTGHGVAENRADAARQALLAGVDMEMVSGTYVEHGERLVQEGTVPGERIDEAVLNVLSLKYALGLFDDTDVPPRPTLSPDNLEQARQAARNACVLLKNADETLPLNEKTVNKIAVLGPLANEGFEQLGTWVFDGKPEASVTISDAIKTRAGQQFDVEFMPVLTHSRSRETADFDRAVALAEQSDVVLLCLGEEAILSGEAHCRTELNLPGAQEALLDAIAQTATPLVLIVMAGRPLTLEHIVPKVDALLYAWHPGTQGGQAVVDLLMGDASPSGKLPVTFMRRVGQIPMYYAQKPTGRPVSEDTFVAQDDYPLHAPQTSLGMASFHIDTHFTPLFPFGFGLTYGKFEVGEPRIEQTHLGLEETLEVSVQIHNAGRRDATDVVQLYIRDVVASLTRPVKQLKGFKRVHLSAGETQNVRFDIPVQSLGFHARNGVYRVEPGEFRLGIGLDSTSPVEHRFWVEAK